MVANRGNAGNLRRGDVSAASTLALSDAPGRKRPLLRKGPAMDLGGTGLEPVTPSVSSWCSNQTELAAHRHRQYPTGARDVKTGKTGERG